MEKLELIREISKRTNTNIDEAEIALDQVIIELASPKILPKPGRITRFINDNACTDIYMDGNRVPIPETQER
ncbi:MAG: hypothetical protein KJ737_27945 [Proteobacteria bacterium]|nr:hypothetical protein [Pseudomonadota bacterium]